MNEINHNGKLFYVNKQMQVKYPKLINLILTTESMNDNEKQYWFDIIPFMNDSQIDKLFNIQKKEILEIKKRLKRLQILFKT